MKAKFIVPLIIFVAFSVLLALGLTMDPRAIPSTFIGKPAPSIYLSNVVEPDSNFDSNSLKGQYWVLNVWASWCVSCRYEHPLFKQLANMGIAPIVGLNYKDQLNEANQWLAQRGNPYIATPFDQTGIVGINWGVVAVPETFVIDPQGIVIYKHTGPIDEQILSNEIIPLLN